MSIKKWFIFLVVIALMLPVFSTTVSAAENLEFQFELTADGKNLLEVEPGELITVTLYLHRTDADASYMMHAMQDEIRYDRDFFKLVEDSIMLYEGVEGRDVGLVDNHREFYMNFLSFNGGEQWNPKVRVGSFQLEVIAESGVSIITNEDYLVALPDGSGSYQSQANLLTVILSTDCTVKFETNGGTPIAPIKVIYGEKITRPADPVREGMHLVGWYKDIHLTQEWDFEKDTVPSNMTLYAKWADGVPAAPEEPSEEPKEPGCAICGRDREGLFGMPICWLCFTGIVLILLVSVFFILRQVKLQKKKKNGDDQPKETPSEE